MTAARADASETAARLRDAVCGLFPGTASVCVRQIHPQNEMVFTYPEEAACVAHAGPVRQRQFFFGRQAAHEALKACAGPTGPLLQSTDGGILWPDGWTGSITHTADWCAAVTARTNDMPALGLDMEEIARMNEPIARRILLPSELEWISRSGQSLTRMGALFFGAKEALYKAAASQKKRFIGFREAEILPEEDGVERWAFHARLRLGGAHEDTRPLLRFQGRAVFCGLWCLAGVHAGASPI